MVPSEFSPSTAVTNASEDTFQSATHDLVAFGAGKLWNATTDTITVEAHIQIPVGRNIQSVIFYSNNNNTTMTLANSTLDGRTTTRKGLRSWAESAKVGAKTSNSISPGRAWFHPGGALQVGVDIKHMLTVRITLPRGANYIGGHLGLQ